MSAAPKSAHAPAKLESNPFDWADPLLLDEELTSEQGRMVRDSARAAVAPTS